MAVMIELTRTEIGPFDAENGLAIEQLREESIESLLAPALSGLGDLPQVVLTAADSVRVGHGLPIEAAISESFDAQMSEAVAITEQGFLRAIIRRKPKGWCPVKVFPV